MVRRRSRRSTRRARASACSTSRSPKSPEADIEAYLARQIRFDPDLWIVEVEDRAGRSFLDHIVR